MRSNSMRVAMFSVAMLAVIWLGAASGTSVKASGGANATASSPPICRPPNGTATRLRVFNCDSKLPIQIISAHVINARTNALVYPLTNKEPMVLIVGLYNNGAYIIDEQFAINISEWGPNANGECVWKPINTHGAFKNFNGCAFAHDCPVPQRYSKITLPLHLQEFQPVINELKHDHAYQLELKIINTSLKDKPAEVGCAISQGLVG